MTVRPKAHTPANPRGLGVTCCSGCGQPADLVGPLLPDGLCSVCSHDLHRSDLLVAELRRLVDPWLAACRARQLPGEDLADVWSRVASDLFHPAGRLPEAQEVPHVR